MDLKFHHIGIACEDIEEMAEEISEMFHIASMTDVVYDSEQKASLRMMLMEDGLQIELVSGEVVASYIKKHNYLYHTCYEVKDMEEVMEKLITEGNFLVSSPKKAILFNNRKVAFFMTKLGLIELLESKDGNDNQIL